MPKIDVTKFIEQSGIRKARFGGYETADVRQAMQALCTEYEQRLNRAEKNAKALAQQNSALEQHCQVLAAQNRRLSEQSATLAGNSEAYARQRAENETQITSLREKNHSLSDQCAVLRLQNADLRKENEDLKEQAAQAEAKLRIKGRDLDGERAALAAARQKMMDDANAEAQQVVEDARHKADALTGDAKEQAQAVLNTAKEQAREQARRLVEAAAAEANEVQNAHQLRLNSLQEEVRGLEQRREQLIIFLNRMARELMQVEGTAKNDAPEEPGPAPSEDLPVLQEVPTPPVELDLGPEAIARAVDELRAQAAQSQEEETQHNEETVTALAAQAEAEAESAETSDAPAGPEAPAAPDDHDPNRQTGPALTEVPGAIFSSPIVHQQESVPDEVPPTADPQMPVMPVLTDEEEDQPEEPDDLPAGPDAAKEPDAAGPKAAGPDARRRAQAVRVVRALRSMQRRTAQPGAAAH